MPSQPVAVGQPVPTAKASMRTSSRPRKALLRFDIIDEDGWQWIALALHPKTKLLEELELSVKVRAAVNDRGRRFSWTDGGQRIMEDRRVHIWTEEGRENGSTVVADVMVWPGCPGRTVGTVVSFRNEPSVQPPWSEQASHVCCSQSGQLAVLHAIVTMMHFDEFGAEATCDFSASHRLRRLWRACRACTARRSAAGYGRRRRGSREGQGQGQ